MIVKCIKEVSILGKRIFLKGEIVSNKIMYTGRYIKL